MQNDGYCCQRIVEYIGMIGDIQEYMCKICSQVFYKKIGSLEIFKTLAEAQSAT